MRFPPEFIERLRNHLPISEVVGRRVQIRKHGREFQGLCPFHKEKSPSFTVNDEKGFFHCFGCGAHGDAIGFIKDYERVTYPEAVEKLAGEAGLPVPQMTQAAQAVERRRLTLQEAVQAAERWFITQLQGPGGAEVRDYLRERGLRQSTVEKFALGYAPPVRDGLKSALLKEGFTEALLKEAGLLASPETGASYDRFRARLIFPIHDAQGRTVAFGGRILPQAQGQNIAKYLNSPETPLFKKGELLFAYDIARKAVAKDAPLIVAEGYMDVIAFHQAGFATAVAPLGTAVTEPQLQLLWRACNEPVFCLDGDMAGARAMNRAAEIALPLLKAGNGMAFAPLPKGQDPDSLLHLAGPAAMRDVLSRAVPLSRLLWERGVESFSAGTPEKRAALERHLLALADRIADPLVKQHMRSFFRDRMFRLGNPKKFQKSGVRPASPDALFDALDDKTHLKPLEEQMVRLVLLCPEILHYTEIEEHFGHMDVAQPALDKVRSMILQLSADAAFTDSASLKEALAARGLAEKVETLLNSRTTANATLHHAGLEQNPGMARQLFEQTHHAYSMRRLKQELREVENVFAREMTEENQSRYFALQKQVSELERAPYSGGPDEPLV